jgi:hypothetical protein
MYAGCISVGSGMRPAHSLPRLPTRCALVHRHDPRRCTHRLQAARLLLQSLNSKGAQWSLQEKMVPWCSLATAKGTALVNSATAQRNSTTQLARSNRQKLPQRQSPLPQLGDAETSFRGTCPEFKLKHLISLPYRRPICQVMCAKVNLGWSLHSGL